MGIRIPSSPVMDYNMQTSTGTTSQTVLLPQDTDNITVLCWATAMGATSVDVYLQTSPDGGTTWYDLANMNFTGVVVQQNARIANFSTVGVQPRTNSATGSAISAAAASTVGSNNYSGIPIMGVNFRVFHKITGTGTNAVRTQVYVNNQASRS